MKKIKTLILFILAMSLLVSASSCTSRPPRTVGRCFYYWKSVFELTNTDLTELQALKVNRLYLKFFDLIWAQDYGEPIPVSVIEMPSKPPTSIEVVPVVFITVDALERLPAEQSTSLAGKINQKINAILIRNHLGRVSEIQLDCDWNSTTKVKYFTILTRLRELAAVQKRRVSATIRLHQVKYASQTGIPPVDQGMLMFYNFDSPKSFGVKNSIFDLQVAKEYTTGLNRYPLRIDLALPLFSWGVLFQGAHFQGLIGNLREKDLAPDPRFRKVKPNCFVALTDCRFQNIQIYQNDTIRVEESRYREILAGARYLAGKIENPHLQLAFFHFDRNLIEGVGGREKINDLFNSLR